MKKIKKKAFIGTIIEGVKDITGTIAGVINAKRQADATKKEYERQQGEIYANEALQLANVLTQEANSQDYVEQMKKRITFKMGGNYNNRFKNKNKIKNKKKANLGTTTKVFGQTGNEYSQVANAGITGSTVAAIMGAINPTETLTLKQNIPIQAQTPKIIKTPNDIVQQTNLAMQQVTNSQARLNQVQNPILSQAKLGTKRVKQKNLNRFK